MNYNNKKLLKTLQGHKFDTPPVWLMRQAGRYLPEYREVRKQAGSFLDLCYNPTLTTEVTLQPLRRFNLDGAILFADILLIPNALGQHLEFKEGIGPILEPLKNNEDIENLRNSDDIHGTLEPVYEAVTNIKSKLETNITFIGFAGSPWTVATYMIEGKGSKDHIKTKTFMLNYPQVFKKLILKIQDATIEYLSKQIQGGVDVIKLGIRNKQPCCVFYWSQLTHLISRLNGGNGKDEGDDAQIGHGGGCHGGVVGEERHERTRQRHAAEGERLGND